MVWLRHRDLSDEGIQQVVELLPRLAGAWAVEFRFSAADLSRPDWNLRIPYALKLWSSAVHASRADARVVVQVDQEPSVAASGLAALLASEDLAPYVDAVEVDADAGGQAPRTPLRRSGREPGSVRTAVRRRPSSRLSGASPARAR